MIYWHGNGSMMCLPSFLYVKVFVVDCILMLFNGLIYGVYFLMLFVQDYTEGTSDKDRKLSVLVEMGFPADEAFSAINRCGIFFF